YHVLRTAIPNSVGGFETIQGLPHAYHACTGLHRCRDDTLEAPLTTIRVFLNVVRLRRTVSPRRCRMSYPEPRYFGSGGEASATFRPDASPHDIDYQSGGSADYLATGAQTDGLFGLYRWNMSAEASGPGPHFHRTMTESFYVLLGTVKIYDGGEWRDCRP